MHSTHDIAIWLAFALVFVLHLGTETVAAIGNPKNTRKFVGTTNRTAPKTTTTAPLKMPAWHGLTSKQNENSNVYYAPDGTCGWWNGQTYEKPLMNYSNAFLPGDEAEDSDDPLLDDENKMRNCLYHFHAKSLTPTCGDPAYPQLKYCELVNYFNNKLPTEFVENRADLLLLADGCVLCKKGDYPEARTVTISLKHTLPAGSFLSGCSEEEKDAGSVTFKLNAKQLYDALVMPTDDENGYERNDKFPPISTSYGAHTNGYSGSFFLRANLAQRTCKGLFGTDAQPEQYAGMKLVVEHDCNGPKNTFIVNLADIGPAKVKNNFVELRAMMLLLDKQTSAWQQFATDGRQFETAESLPNKLPVYTNLKEK